MKLEERTRVGEYVWQHEPRGKMRVTAVFYADWTLIG
jgi:hypothetical protein